MEAAKILILGGGFAGLQAVRALSRAGLPTTLIERNAYTTMLPVLPDLAADWIPEEKGCQPIAGLLPENCRFKRATVIAVDPNSRVVETSEGRFPYDYLLVATGSVADLKGLQADGPIHSLDSLESARRIHRAWKGLIKTHEPTLVFAGAGYTGIELALALAAQLKKQMAGGSRIVMIERNTKILPFLTDLQRAYVQRKLSAANIELWLETTVRQATEREVILSNGEIIRHHLLLATSGSRAAVDNFKDALELVAGGRISVNSCLQAQGHDRIFAAGDAAAITDLHSGILRKAVNFSYYSGRRAGRNIALAIAGRPPQPFRPFDAGWVIPLYDTAVGNLFSRLRVKGRLPLRLHYFMCGWRHYTGRKKRFFYKLALRPSLNLCEIKAKTKSLKDFVS